MKSPNLNPMAGHVYIIKNTVNSKVYVGQTIVDILIRFEQHCCKTSNCVALRNAIMKHGRENFKIESVFQSDSLEELNKREKELIEELKSLSPNGYNLRTGGDRFSLSDETRKKMSKSKLGVPKSEETKRRMSEAWKGVPKPKSLEWRENQSIKMTGKKHSSESKRKMSNAKKKKVICNETGIVYPSIFEAAFAIGCHHDNLKRHLSGKYKMCKGFTFRLLGANNEN